MVDDLMQQGIEGYHVKVAGCPVEFANEYAVNGNNTVPGDQLYVPRQLYQGVVEKLFAAEGSSL